MVSFAVFYQWYGRLRSNGINKQGQVVCVSVADSSAGCLPSCWTINKADGLLSELKLTRSTVSIPNEPTVYAGASGINESGLIVGGWDNGGGMSRLLAMRFIGPVGKRYQSSFRRWM